MKKNILLTSALASSLMFLGSNAIAQTKIDGTLAVAQKTSKFDASASKITNGREAGREAQLNISNSGKTSIAGLNYAAGFALEFDGASEKATDGNLSIGNENTYVDLIFGDTTLTFGVDHIQNSDRSTAHFVGLNFEDGDVANTYLLSAVGANPKEAMGMGVTQKTPFGTFSALYVPGNGVNGRDDDLDGALTEAAQGVNSTLAAAGLNDRSSAYELGFAGNLGVQGLNLHVFQNKEKSSPGSHNFNTGLKGYNLGASYNFGQFTFGVDRKKSEGSYVATSSTVIGERDKTTSQTSYGIAYAITPTLTLGASMAKANTSGLTSTSQTNYVTDEKARSVALGYNLGPVVAEIQYAKYENAKGVDTADFSTTFAKLSTKF